MFVGIWRGAFPSQQNGTVDIETKTYSVVSIVSEVTEDEGTK